MAKRIIGSALVGMIALALTLFWRGFPPRLALLSGVAFAILAYSTHQALGRLSALYRRP